ncbi:multifunctional fatty acid oxidation complex subunit alpha [Shewanella mangrovi]|uniref:enoyl-CoA hydratase n=1 Tax=Shewanella mangrovi TaxID=1515746 RepID=A0A094JA76_9GAMM|nr:fatty acid oxidation complex subunit alpha FadB [Shewanella mangrovi]KFZ36162.1 multifunctional fatty acid oxidation complex subunit alpha [Shewanella mangrovi]
MLYQSSTLKVSINNQIAHLQFDREQSAINKFDRQTLSDFDHALDAISAATDIQGLLLSSNKDSFIVGADITEFLALFAEEDAKLYQWLQSANAIFNKLEDLPFPTVCAVNSFALGGGCETVLATDFRVASEDARIGLPETKLGIIPGFGGTVRLPRLIGVDNAIELITTAKECRSNEALALGLVDAVVTKEQLLSSAESLLQLAINNDIDWQQRRQQKQQPLSLSQLEQTMSFNVAKGLVYAKAGKHYPAPMAALIAIERSAADVREQALVNEHQAFVSVAKTPTAKSLIQLFLNDQQVKSLAKKQAGLANKTAHAAVIGAGIMGGGIAYQSASKKVPVVMKDIAPQAIELGLSEASKLLQKQLERGRITADKMAGVLNSITPSLSYEAIRDCDVVVEAVVENPKVKATVLAEVEQHVSDDTIITSNTSTISINQLAKTLRKPERFCGMHFFNPVHRMPLVEVIKSEVTSDETVATVVSYATQMGKTAIVVNDCPGFFVNRVLFPYFAGFCQLVADGADYTMIDKVMEKVFGWPMGPAYLLDVVGIDTAHHAQQVMADGFPERMAVSYEDAIHKLFSTGKFGQKTGSGFYCYSKDKRGKVVKVPAATQAELSEATPKSFTEDEIIARVMIPMINETLLCLDEGIVQSAAEADLALIYGLGFPPFRGGVFSYLEQMGLFEYQQWARKYQDLGSLYRVPQLLQDRIDNNQAFYHGA